MDFRAKALAWTVAAFVVFCVFGAHAHAQGQTSLAATSHIDMQLFKPSADSAGLLNMNVGGTGGHLTMRGGIWIDYSNSLLRTSIANTSVKLGSVVSNRVDATAIATLSLFQRLEIGVAMPYNIFENGLNTNLVRDVIGKQDLSKSGVSDLRLMVRRRTPHRNRQAPRSRVGRRNNLPDR